jgi:hypothetical protein
MPQSNHKAFVILQKQCEKLIRVSLAIRQMNGRRPVVKSLRSQQRSLMPSLRLPIRIRKLDELGPPSLSLALSSPCEQTGILADGPATRRRTKSEREILGGGLN